jgi:hypothetical protein
MEVSMDGQRSRQALGEFLDYLAEKGLMAGATVAARKAAATKILGILDESQANDVTTVDVDDVVARFGRLHGKDYTPQSLTTYQSRLRSALDDFRSYLNNPLGFRPSTQNRAARTRAKMGKDDQSERGKVDRSEAPRPAPIVPPMAASNILPIPIRADLVVHIQGLPFDLTEGEARKIAAVVTAMAQTK